MEIFRRTVRSCMGPASEVARTATVGEAVNSMARTGAAAVIVSDPDRKPSGIVTRQDVVQRIAWRATPDQPLETVMSTPVLTIAAEAPLFNALCLMRRHNLRRIPVVDGAGRLAGLLELHAALDVLSGISMRLIDRLTPDEGVDGLKRVKEAEVDLAKELLRDDVPISLVQAVLAEIDWDLHRHAIVRAITEMAGDGWGDPPVPFALIVMGSGGRGESSLHPDQDNGFILADYDDADHARIEAYFVPLAVRFTRLLDAIGFSLCVGNIMATNPVWRKRISEWRKQISLWLRKRTETQLLLSDVLLDFRHVWGDPALSSALRGHLTRAVAQNPTFIRDLFTIEAGHTAALGWFGRLRSERDKQDRSGMINLKLGGTLPLVEAARLLSLKAGVPATSTLARLDGLLAKGALHPDDHDDLIDAFAFISRLLLRRQIEDLEAGRQVGNFVPEAQLKRREKDHLVTCFRAIGHLRDKLKADLTGSTL
jgi:signal-transduction protein with cAMP-binding, CBS, and nucleotidyltransferase domain